MTRSTVRFVSVVFGVLAGAVCLNSGSAHAQIERISVALDGTEANHNSYEAALSDDGSVIAFRSSADNLIAGDDNELPDVFIRDFESASLEWANVDTDGTPLSYGFYRNAFFPSVSDDGSRVSYNMYPGLTRLAIRDRVADTTLELLAGGAGQEREEPQLSGNGQFLVFHSQVTFQSGLLPATVRPLPDNFNAAFDIFVYDIDGADTIPLERVSRPDFSSDTSCINAMPPDCPEINGDSMSASVSDDASRIAFYSYATDLIPDDTNGHEDIFVKFRVDQGAPVGIAGPVIRASVASDGTEADGDSYDPALSGNGQYVVFRSLATNLVASDTNGVWDIFVHDIGTGQTERVSVASDGTQADGASFSPRISDDGRFVVFRSNATNLVPGDSNARFDIFVHDRDSDQTVRVSVPAGGGEADNHSYLPAISGDGRWIVFESDATNLVIDDTNRARDIFRVPNPLTSPRAGE